MTTRTWPERIGEVMPREFFEWASSVKGSLERTWETCPRGDWMLELAAHALVDGRRLTLAAAAVAREALPFLPHGDGRPLAALEAAEAWARDELKIDGIKAVAATEKEVFAALPDDEKKKAAIHAGRAVFDVIGAILAADVVRGIQADIASGRTGSYEDPPGEIAACYWETARNCFKGVPHHLAEAASRLLRATDPVLVEADFSGRGYAEAGDPESARRANDTAEAAKAEREASLKRSAAIVAEHIGFSLVVSSPGWR